MEARVLDFIGTLETLILGLEDFKLTSEIVDYFFYGWNFIFKFEKFEFWTLLKISKLGIFVCKILN